jgi:hypothetical protein
MEVNGGGGVPAQLVMIPHNRRMESKELNDNPMGGPPLLLAKIDYDVTWFSAPRRKLDPGISEQRKTLTNRLSLSRIPILWVQFGRKKARFRAVFRRFDALTDREKD